MKTVIPGGSGHVARRSMARRCMGREGRLEQNPGIRRQNVVIQLTEVDRANWSCGNGEA